MITALYTFTAKDRDGAAYRETHTSPVELYAEACAGSVDGLVTKVTAEGQISIFVIKPSGQAVGAPPEIQKWVDRGLAAAVAKCNARLQAAS